MQTKIWNFNICFNGRFDYVGLWVVTSTATTRHHHHLSTSLKEEVSESVSFTTLFRQNFHPFARSLQCHWHYVSDQDKNVFSVKVLNGWQFLNNDMMVTLKSKRGLSLDEPDNYFFYQCGFNCLIGKPDFHYICGHWKSCWDDYLIKVICMNR